MIGVHRASVGWNRAVIIVRPFLDQNGAVDCQEPPPGTATEFVKIAVGEEPN
jgi:hypothetical protein